MMSVPLAYHEATKHSFYRLARSLGYLDWATQPDPFRRFDGARNTALPRDVVSAAVPYSTLYSGEAAPVPVDERAIGEFLRCSMGLSAWKQYGRSRWALRVNPSSGNLHPTETYVVRRAAQGAEVCHYDVQGHALERRCAMGEAVLPGDLVLVGLTSIHWREAWKYGERAFRYCQHDAGHAIGALRLAAALLGWKLILLPGWSHADLSTLLGTGRDEDFGDAEREEPECLAVAGPGDVETWRTADPGPLVAAARAGIWSGKANRLSPETVPWALIDDVAAATRVPDRHEYTPDRREYTPDRREYTPDRREYTPDRHEGTPDRHESTPDRHEGTRSARALILQRRSAVAFDGRSTLPRDTFERMLRRLQPGAAPWDAIDWPPHVHLAIFVHRVADLTPGLYLYLRDPAALDELRAAMRPEFLWEPIVASSPLAPSPPAPSPPAPCLFLLVPIDARRTANRVSCDQDIAADGFFSLGMIARFESPLITRGAAFYRRLFWESGLIGQVLYLEAEAAGARATGIGCYYDDPVHELLGLADHAWQSLYHFSMGMPVDDHRLMTEPGYAWE